MDNELAKLKAFVKAVEKGSLTKAAESLNYAQSSISKMIADLEDSYKVTLLERNRNGVCLTPSGEQILPFARKILNDYRELEEYISCMHGIQSGFIRIGIFASVAINLLPEIFADFQQRYPNIEYELLLGDYDEIEQWLNESRIDCGFLRLPTVSAFDTVPFCSDEYKVVLPANHRLAKNKTVKIEDLNGEPFLLLEHGGKTEVTKLLEENGVCPDIKFTTWEDFAIMAMVEKGLGVSILPSMILKRIPYKIEIRSLRGPFFREIGAAVKRKSRLAPATERFIEYLKLKKAQTTP